VLASGLVLAAGWERERDGAAADSDPAVALAAWEQRAQGLGQRGRGARALFDGSQQCGLTAMAERRARRSGSLKS
jgi:hypothetical protein